VDHNDTFLPMIKTQLWPATKQRCTQTVNLDFVHNFSNDILIHVVPNDKNQKANKRNHLIAVNSKAKATPFRLKNVSTHCKRINALYCITNLKT